MSKSDENPNASIYLLDEPDAILRKCKRAVTDSEGQILYRDEQPGSEEPDRYLQRLHLERRRKRR